MASVLLCGCARWQADRFDFSHLRDQRAMEIDNRLSKAAPAVPNPFGTTEPQRDTD